MPTSPRTTVVTLAMALVIALTPPTPASALAPGSAKDRGAESAAVWHEHEHEAVDGVLETGYGEALPGEETDPLGEGDLLGEDDAPAPDAPGSPEPSVPGSLEPSAPSSPDQGLAEDGSDDAADGMSLVETLTDDPGADPDVALTSSASRGPASRIAAGERHSLYLDGHGQVWAWGANESGQLGDGTTVAAALPVRVSMTGTLAGTEVVAVAAGLRHSMALDAEGRVHAWGNNDRGQLGDGTRVNRTTPVRVAGLLADQRVVQIAGGGRTSTASNFFSSSAAVGENGRVYTWGAGERGRLGNGTTTAAQTTPVVVGGLVEDVHIVEVAVGLRHMVALSEDGQVFSWGYRTSGSLGNNVTSTGVQSTPVAVSTAGALDGVRSVQLAAGLDGSRLLGDDGRVFGWGANSDGRLGNGTTTGSAVPVGADMEALGALGNSPVQLAAGESFTLALGDHGRVAAWGAGSSGQLGNGSTAVSTRAVAVDVTGVMAGADIVEITAGTQHALALAADGRLFSWGRGVERQLGDGGTATSNVPVPVGGLRVSTQPADVVVPTGTGASFQAVAEGAVATVQWEVSTDTGQTWSAVEGATATTYTTPPSTPEMDGQRFRAVFVAETAFPQRVISGEATLTVEGPPVITLHPPQRVRAWAGQEVVIAADATGTGPVTVQWQRSSDENDGWSDVPGERDRDLAVPTTSDQHGMRYRAVFSNPVGAATTDAARLEVFEPADVRMVVRPTARLVTAL